MNLYLLTQEENNSYDTYDSIIVCAETAGEAICIHPTEGYDAVIRYYDGAYRRPNGSEIYDSSVG